jgi:ABC-type oligopeptide transport system ATPase subunit
MIIFKNVSKFFDIANEPYQLKAVDNVSFHINTGETLAIVGESGSGKSTLARMLMKLEHPSSGSILINNEQAWVDIAHINPATFYPLIQMVFQDPYACLNSRKKIWEIVSSCRANLGFAKSRSERRTVAAVTLEMVGLRADVLDAYPNQLSGGQRQRVSIGRALAAGPKVVVLDEPLSALDVSIQAQIVNLLLRLKQQLNLTYLFISHDLAMVRHLADSVIVMHSGRLIEQGKVPDTIDHPKHPYTRALIEASFLTQVKAQTPIEKIPEIHSATTFKQGA